MLTKEFMALLSVITCIASTTIYMRATARGKFKPHMFSWIVWGLLMLIAAAAQYSRKAGIGAWATGFGGVMCLVVAGQAVVYGEKNITRSDWAAFIAAPTSIPLWYVTANPLTATVFVTMIDAFGYYPTFRKSYQKPHQEALFVFVLYALISFMRLLAVESYSLTTALYPAFIATANTAFIVMLLWRRRIVARKVAATT